MPAQGVAIEAHLDKGRGPVATVLVHRGTLRIGDSIVAGSAHGRVRALINDQGETMDSEAPPSMPVQVLGLTSVPGAGDNVLVVEDDRMARQIADKREARMRAAQQAKTSRRKTLDQLFEQLEKGEAQELLLILKGDGAGSVEALEDALSKIEVNDEVSLRVIDRGVGAITETNVSLAAASKAVIIGFNVRPTPHAAQMADRENVDMRFYSVIYSAIDEIEAALKGMLKPIFAEEVRGQAEIREIFRSSKFGNIAGCMVTDGTIRRNASARLLRDGVVVATSIHRFAAAREGRRHRGPRGLRVRCHAQQLQRHPDRRRHRDVRDGGEGALLMPGPRNAKLADQIKVILATDHRATRQGSPSGLRHHHGGEADRRQPRGHRLLHGAG